MALTDPDLRFFAEALEGVKDPESRRGKDSFLRTEAEEPVCLEYGFETAAELRALLDRFVETGDCGAAARERLLRACAAGVYKYARRDREKAEKSTISEYIYEF